MTIKLAPAKLKAAPPLTPQEAALVEGVILTRPKGWFARLKLGMAYATKVVPRSEFDRVCLMVVKELDGMTILADEAASKAKRLIEAYTQAKAGVIVTKCDISDQAVMVAYLGDPQSGFLFQRALQLKDPKGAKRV